MIDLRTLLSLSFSPFDRVTAIPIRFEWNSASNCSRYGCRQWLSLSARSSNSSISSIARGWQLDIVSSNENIIKFNQTLIPDRKVVIFINIELETWIFGRVVGNNLIVDDSKVEVNLIVGEMLIFFKYRSNSTNHADIEYQLLNYTKKNKTI